MNGDENALDDGYDDDPTAGASDVGGRAGEPQEDEHDDEVTSS